MTLQEMLQKRAELVQKMRAMLDKAKAETRDFSEDEAKEFDGYKAEIEGLELNIQAIQKQDERERLVADREKAIDHPSASGIYRPSALYGAPVQAAKKDDGGFKNLGELIHAVRFGDPKGRLQELPIGQGQGGGYGVPEAFRSLIMPQVRAEFSMGVGTEGGFAVPEQFRPDVLMLNPESSIVRPRATVLPAGEPADAKITMPALDQGTNGVYGGVEVQWIAEGDEKPDTSASLKEVTLQPHEVAATTIVTDKLLRNWAAADQFIRSLLRNAMTAAEDMAFLTGNGTGKPTGLIGAAGAKVVKRGTANSVKTDDIINMLGALLPESLSGSIWVANQSLLPEIAKLQDAAGNYIFIQGDMTRGIPSTLLGLPIRFTGKNPAKGSKGDLVLADLTYYLIKDGSGPFIAASEHVLFKQNKTVIKAFWNVDGKPWVVAPLTLENGVTTVSPYVVLDVPQV